MVVVSGSWVKNVASYPPPIMSNNNSNEMVISMNNSTSTLSNNNAMCAKAILICRPNSHPFQERTLSLDQPVKVGRSVARARATSTNAIFDCKVLSRHHALIFYDCGKFYLQVTLFITPYCYDYFRLFNLIDNTLPLSIISNIIT